MAINRFIETNGICLHCLDHPGDEPLLILMPGLTANCHAFDGLIHAGLSPRFRALTIDLRGRGESDKPEEGYRMADHAADVIGLMDELGIENAILGGHSFGGLLTMYMAAHYPDRFTCLVIIDAALAAASVRTREQIQPALARLGQVLPSWDAYIEMIKQAPYYHGWTWDPIIENYYRADVEIYPDGTVQARARPEHIAAAMDGVLAEDWHALTAAVQQPALLLQAPGPFGPSGAPPVVSLEQAKETAHALVNCRLVSIPGNHMTIMFGEGATHAVEAIAGFVQE